jgi:hypothetical protein
MRDFTIINTGGPVHRNMKRPHQHPLPGYRFWSGGINYAIDDKVTQPEGGFKCILAHKSEAGCFPVNHPELWELIP